MHKAFIDCLKCCYHSLFYLFVSGIFLPGFAANAAEDLLFDEYETTTGSAGQQTVLTGFLLDNAIADLAVVHIDENGSRSLRIFRFDNAAWEPFVEASLRRDVLFVDVVSIGGQDRLITYERGRLNWFDPESAAERSLLSVNANINPPPGDEIPHVDISRDVNHDGRDDLVVPDGMGTWVYVQIDGGRFADPIRMGPPVNMNKVYRADGYRYKPWNESGIHELDYNMDSRSDLVFWNHDHFAIHYQNEQGLFDPVAETFAVDVTFDSADPSYLAAPQELHRRRRDQQLVGLPVGRVLHSFADVNADHVADLVVFWLDIESMWSVHSAYEVHFGALAAQGIDFSPDVGATILSSGVPFGLQQFDFEQDGQLDVMFTTLKIGVFRMISMIARGVLTSSVALQLEFYRMDSGSFPSKPNASLKIPAHAPGVSGEKGILYPPILIGEVNGDRHADLLVGRGQEEMQVYPGVPGTDVFDRRPQKIAVAMAGEEYTWLSDINKDGKQDIIMHHRSTTEQHRVTALIAQ